MLSIAPGFPRYVYPRRGEYDSEFRRKLSLPEDDMSRMYAIRKHGFDSCKSAYPCHQRNLTGQSAFLLIGWGHCSKYTIP